MIAVIASLPFGRPMESTCSVDGRGTWHRAHCTLHIDPLREVELEEYGHMH